MEWWQHVGTWAPRKHLPAVGFNHIFYHHSSGVKSSVGELGKNLTPSKSRVCWNSWDKFANHPRDEDSSFVKVEHSWRDPDKSQVFFRLSSNMQKIIAESGFYAWIYCLFQGGWICEALEPGTCKILEAGTCEVRELVEVLIRKLQWAVFFTNKRFGDHVEAKSKTSSQKVQVSSVN
jgi:hypothetical protein